MKYKLRIYSLFLTLLFTTGLFIPHATANSLDSEQGVEEVHELLMSLPKADFLQMVTDICNGENASALIAAAIAFKERPDISAGETVEIATSSNNSTLLRHIALERYTATRPITIDNSILNMIANPNENARLRSYAIATLATSMEKQHAKLLISAANHSDESLAFNSIKALEKVDQAQAVTLSASIYDSYKTESPARINIATKVLSRYFSEPAATRISPANLSMTKEEYIAISKQILSATENAEIKLAVSSSASTVSNEAIFTSTSGSRATGFQGYAAYRDGVSDIDIIGATGFWHGAIIYGPATSMMYYIFAQATGTGATTELVSYSEFMGDDNNPQGYYRPSSTVLTSAQRDAVCATAGELANEHIEYQLSSQIDYSTYYNDGGRYTISDIVAIRCDGLIEFSYEYNGIRVSGTSTNWDITKRLNANQIAHSGTQIYPKKQAEERMVRLGSL